MEYWKTGKNQFIVDSLAKWPQKLHPNLGCEIINGTCQDFKLITRGSEPHK